MSLRNEVLLAAQAQVYVAYPTDSVGSSPQNDNSVDPTVGTIADWVTANGQTPPQNWRAAFVAAMYRNLGLAHEYGNQTTPEGIWRSAYALGLISPEPVRGCIVLVVRLNSAGLLDESNIYAASAAGIFCRWHEDGREILAIVGRESFPPAGSFNRGVIYKFYDVEKPVSTDATIGIQYVVPGCIRYGG